MSNTDIARHFSQYAKLLEIHGENSFKSKSYTNAAYNIEQIGQDVGGMAVEELYQQRGIGQSIGEKILQILKTGHMEVLEELIAATPPGVLEMIRIKGLGPKKINAVWKKLNVEDIGELEYACTENRIASLSGFGAKTQQTISEAIAFYRASQGFHLWAHVQDEARTAIQDLQNAFPKSRFELTGAIRRQEEVVEGIEILTDVNADDLIEHYAAIEEKTIELPADDHLTIRIPGQPALRFYLSNTKDFFEKLFHTSASEEFYEAFVSQYKISEAPESEEEIFTKNDLPFIPPAIRESPANLQLAAAGKIPDLIRPADIRGIIHSHSTWSDGKNTIEEMARGAMAAGYEYLVMSDHSQAAQYANGLSPERIIAQHHEIDALNKKLAPFRIFKSIEADILGDGSLDYGPEVWQRLDLVIASVHSNLTMNETKAMDRLLNAIANPYTTILGHATGRLLLSRKGYPVDHKVLIDACAEYNVVLEINANPRRLDIDWRWVSYAMERGVMLSIDPDAHSVKECGYVHYGVMVAQKGGLTMASNLSSLSLEEFEEFLRKRRGTRGL